ncbi:MAG TPA: family 78 glycoside hydrolase catalytic domain [Steroidobacteraceae bacterium]|jgi:alpha-L-rhamnosidase
MRNFVLALAGISAVLAGASSAFGSDDPIRNLRTEYFENPLGLDVAQPRFSWQLHLAGRGRAQSSYEIRVGNDEQALRGGLGVLWDSGRVISDQSIQNPYAGPALQSRQRYFWQVRVWDEQQSDLGWSGVAHWEMGLLTPPDWSANWISPAPNSTSEADSLPALRREFQLRGAIRSARIYITSHGLYEFFLNGKRVGDQVLTPGWTSYGRRLQYQTYDVTALLRTGDNAMGAYLAQGWYREGKGFEAWRNADKAQLALLCQLEVTYADGHRDILGSDSQWKSAGGPILNSQIYDGESYDARLEKIGWDSSRYDDRGWAAVQSLEAPKDGLIAPQGPPVRRIEELAPKRIFKTPGGDTVVDLGQNMVGWIRLKVAGPRGAVVTLRHAEVLDRNGNFYSDNLRTAKQTVRYTLRGRGTETYEPHFTFQGFRYVAVSGYPGKLSLASLTGIVVHSDMPVAGEFSTSNPLINQLQHNIQWGQKGNFLDVPTDCPQRDERLGWTGDAQVFAPTAAFNMEVAGFFTKWLKDLAADQLSSGSVPFVIPDAFSTPDKPLAGAAGWGDAATIIPWQMYLAYGDTRILATQYDSMQKWVAYEQARAGADNIWDGDVHFGDWLDFFSASKNTSYGSTSTDLIATAYFARSTQILQQAARVLGKSADAARYAESLGKIKEAFQQRFVAADGTVGEGTQTAYVLALDFDLLPESLQTIAARKLAQDVRERRHLTTGFLGTPHLLNVLSRFGYLSEAYLLINREEFPSWLYPIKHGATTIWERWDGIKPDGSFQDNRMNSFNHYAYGAVGEWMYEVLGGINIDPNAPAYKHVLIQVQPGGGFTQAHSAHDTPYGRVSTDWLIRGGRLRLSVTVPSNAGATLRLPGVQSPVLGEGAKTVSVGDGIKSVNQQEGDTVIEVGSGHYVFSYAYSAGAQSP